MFGWTSPIGIGIFLLCIGGVILCLSSTIFLLTKIAGTVGKLKCKEEKEKK